MGKKKKEEEKGCEISRIPYEIVKEIFYKLSVTSLITGCRYVCKLWQQFLLDTDFTKSHLSMRNAIDPFLCVEGNKLWWLEFEGESHYHNLGVELKISCSSRTDIFSSCNGLVCVCQDDTIHIINPITCEYISYPLCERDEGSRLLSDLCGVGFDHTTGKFKVLRVTYPPSRPYRGNKKWKVQVCTLDGGPWRSVVGIPEFDTICVGTYPFLNGCHHILAESRGGHRICAFDYISEQFKIMAGPPVANGAVYDWLNIGVVSDFLYLCRSVYVGDDGAFKIEAWRMMEYGVVGSWKKTHVLGNILNLENSWDYHGIRLLGDGINILLHDEAGFVLFNPKTGGLAELDDEIRSKYCPMLHIPSFASLNDMEVVGVGEVKSWKCNKT